MNTEKGFETRKASKLREILPAFSVVAVFLALWYWWFLSPRGKHFATTRASSSTHISADLEGLLNSFALEPAPQIYADAPSGRAVFPYSVIPGGVRSGQELAEATQHDTLVAQHYAGFQLRNARMIHLKKDRLAYVSYRLGERIFWTRHKVTLHAGEALVTDGKTMARGRCGNRLSDSPKAPVSDREPGERILSTPVFVPDPAPLGFPVEDSPLARIALPPRTFGPPPNAPPGGPFPPFFPPIFPGGLGTPSRPPGPPPPGPPTVATPEPASALLVLLGLAGLALASLMFKK